MEEPDKPHPDEKSPIRAPYVPLAIARRTISLLTLCVAGLVLTVVILAVGFSTSINRKPWVLGNFGDGYQEIGLGRQKISRADVEQFLNFVIPNLYGSLNGSAPGLKEIRGLVNENILTQQESELEDQRETLRRQGISQFAIVTGINPDTLVINRNRNFVYVEALGRTVLTREDKSRETEVQWRCLLYIVEPSDALRSNTPAGEMRGNRMGLFLNQLAEQEPGTVNEDSPKPNVEDLREREEERQRSGQAQ